MESATFLAMILVLAAVTLLAAATVVVHRSLSPHPEITRKIAHVTSGLVALSFPWIFPQQPWPVIALCAFAVAAASYVRVSPLLRRRIGDVIHDVQRDSYGEIYFAIAVALLFVASAGERMLYVIPILVLTLADGAAALTGVYRRRAFPGRVVGGKSAAGSVAFFVVAFLCVLIPLVVSGTPVAVAWWTALTAAVVTAGIEWVATRGLDNLLIPAGCFAVLKLMAYLTL